MGEGRLGGNEKRVVKSELGGGHEAIKHRRILEPHQVKARSSSETACSNKTLEGHHPAAMDVDRAVKKYSKQEEIMDSPQETKYSGKPGKVQRS